MHRLKRPVPRLRSAATSGSITPNVAELTASSSCTATVIPGDADSASRTPRSGSVMNATSMIGRRP